MVIIATTWQNQLVSRYLAKHPNTSVMGVQVAAEVVVPHPVVSRDHPVRIIFFSPASMSWRASLALRVNI